MLKKRLIGVIPVKDGWAVQSFGYRRHLPLGRPECLAENLDRWGVDEIMVLCIDRSRKRLGPDFDLLKRLGALGLSTPLTYGGGVRTVEDAASVIQSGAERLCLDTALHGDHAPIRDMATSLGTQALIAAYPLSIEDGRLHSLDYVSGRSRPFAERDISLLTEGVISEALIIDWRHEGQAEGFDLDLVRQLPFNAVQLIAFGGVSSASQIASLLCLPCVDAVGIGNFLSYTEHAVQTLKRQLTELPLRPAIFASTY